MNTVLFWKKNTRITINYHNAAVNHEYYIGSPGFFFEFEWTLNLREHTLFSKSNVLKFKIKFFFLVHICTCWLFGQLSNDYNCNLRKFWFLISFIEQNTFKACTTCKLNWRVCSCVDIIKFIKYSVVINGYQIMQKSEKIAKQPNGGLRFKVDERYFT